ncbi:MAG: methionine aminotransferase [Balneolaceae bacterium]
MKINSKLPNVGTNIFSVMAKMSNDHNAINLSQGFPDFPVSQELIDGIYHYMNIGRNQYPPMTGVPELRKNIAKKIHTTYNWNVDMDEEITVTAGAIEGINSTITAFVNSGDEVIIIDPAYDAYAPIIELNGAQPISVPLKNDDFSIDWNRVKNSISDRTRMLIINSPHNPTGSIISRSDLEILTELTRNTDILVLSDEVYEHIIFDGEIHQSVLWIDELRQRSIAVYSFGKTFHATGWRVGYVIAPAFLTKEIRKVHQYMAFVAHTPTQLAIADYLENPVHYESVCNLYQPKRDLFLKLMKDSRFEPAECSGTYFQLMSYKNISDRPDTEMAEWITKEHGVASIPISVFYKDRQDNKMLRFCFAKGEETLQKAAEILCKI